jgi:hypothetical protein
MQGSCAASQAQMARQSPAFLRDYKVADAETGDRISVLQMGGVDVRRVFR